MNEFFFLKKISQKTIAITGSNGFVSKHVIDLLHTFQKKKNKIIKINSDNTDYSDLDQLVKKFKKVDYVIHLSSATGGIKYTKENMSDQFYITMLRDLNIFEACKKAKVSKIITLGNLHAYPIKLKGAINESNIHQGLPNKTHLGIGWAKRNLSVMSEIFSKKSKTKFIVLYSANAYGPGDSRDLNYGHIIPTMILKCLKNINIELFGGTNAVREFIYVKDLASIILLSLVKIKKSCYLNVGSGEKVTIKKLISLISQLTKFDKKIINLNKIKDNSKRFCDNKLYNKLIKYKIKYNLISGLKETIDWYKIKNN
jgi:GDP-L-fucose synthase